MSDSATLKMLQRIDARLERLENKINEAPTILQDGLSILGDSLDEQFNPQSQEGINNLEKVHKVQKLLKTLSEDQNIDSLQSLLESLGQLSRSASQLGQLENGISIFADSIDEFFAYAMENGLDVEDFANNLKKFSFLIIKAFESGALTDLVESGILDPQSIRTVGDLGHSMAISCDTCSEAGPSSIFRALFNKDIQRSLGFTLRLATHFGQTLEARKTTLIKN